MGFLDKLRGKGGDLKGKASGLVDEHGDKVGGAVDKAKDFVDDKTGGKFGDKTDAAADKAKDAADNLDGQDDDIK